jgi:hypothetical protein
MTFNEFKALQPNDRIANPMTGSYGVVESIDEKGVKVRWGSSPLARYYPVVTTAWMHWAREVQPTT